MADDSKDIVRSFDSLLNMYDLDQKTDDLVVALDLDVEPNATLQGRNTANHNQLIFIAAVHLIKDNLIVANRMIKQAREINETGSLNAMLLLATSLIKESRLEESARLTAWIIKNFEPSAKALEVLAVPLFLADSVYPELIVIADRLVQMNPNDPWSYHRRANCFKKLGNLQKALQDLKKANELADGFFEQELVMLTDDIAKKQ